jgi:GNAT superfamily N-acetyltransferase
MSLQALVSNSGLAGTGPYHPRIARPEDAPTIYALKEQAFGDSYLLYTIYQAPQSVRYLARLIAEAHKLSGQGLVVIEHDGKIRGYYHAMCRTAQYFLNYIAVTQEAEHLGLGSVLLRHFEETGKDIGRQMLALDVFDSNPFVRDWYYRHGYRLTEASFCVRLAMDALPGNGAPLLCQQDALVHALAEEGAWGFSKVECQYGSGHLTVGLIAGHTCKLLDYSGLSVKDAALAIASRFKRKRKALIISALPHLPSGWPILSSEKLLRLVKTVE